MEDIAALEDTVQADIFLYDIDIVDRSTIGKLVRMSAGKHSNTFRLLRYNSHVCYVFKINDLFKAYRCPSCDQFINRADNLEQHLTTYTERVEHVFPKIVYQLRETVFGKLYLFNILTPMIESSLRTWQYLI